MMRSVITSHQQAIILEQTVGILEHDAVHVWKQLGSFQEPDVHHGRLVKHCRIVLYMHKVQEIGKHPLGSK